MDTTSFSDGLYQSLAISLLKSISAKILKYTSLKVVKRIGNYETPVEKTYEIAITKICNRYPDLDPAIIDDFLSRDEVVAEIENYLKRKDKNDSFTVLKNQFFILVNESGIPIEDAEKILECLFSTIEEIIREDPSLQICLLEYYLEEAKKAKDEIARSSEEIRKASKEISELEELIIIIGKELATIKNEYKDRTLAFTSFENTMNSKLDNVVKNSEKVISICKQNYSGSIFISYDLFFSPLTDNRKLFNHTLPLVGRAEYVKQLDNFINSEKKIALICGRGGIGKTRLLLEFSHRFTSKYSDWDLMFLCEGVRLSENSLNMLPDKKCVIVVDNAHSRKDILILCELAQQSRCLVKMIFSCRPQGLEYIKSTCMRGRFDIREIESIPEIQELNPDQTEQLVKLALREEYNPYLESLLQMFRDSPLALVVGGKLIAETKINPSLLESNKQFQDTILGRFQEDVIFRTNVNESDNYIIQDLLTLISALSPIQDINEFREMASNFIGVKKSKLIKSIDVLEKKGILINKGSKLKITPKVLSDYILSESCLTSYNNLTGYADEIFYEFGDKFLNNLLYNLSELEWRIRLGNNRIDLLNKIWGKIEKDFKKGSNSQRLETIRVIDKVAYFTPERTLSLIKYAINNPIKEDSINYFHYQTTHQNLLNEFPSLLKKISFNIEYLIECCDILWNIGIISEDKNNYFSDHVLRTLIDLAEYDLYKPLEFNSLIFDFVERKMKYIEDPESIVYLLDILDPLLKKEGLAYRSTGFKINSIPFVVPYDKTKEIRERAISLIEENLKSESLSVSLRALKSLSEALNPPTGFFGKKATDDEISIWLPEQMKILEIIEDVSKTRTSHILQIQIKSSLYRHARQSNQPEVADKAKSILESMIETFETKLLRAIWYHYDWDYKNFEEYQEKVSQEIKEISQEFLEKCNYEGQKVFDSLNEIISKLKSSRIEINPEDFLIILSSTNHEIACEVCNHIISDASKPLATYLSSILSGIRHKNNTEAIILTKAVIAGKDPVLSRSVAEGYAHRGWAFKLNNEEIEIISKLLGSLEEDTRILAIRSLRHFPENMMNEALELALSIEIGTNEKLADVYCSIFDLKHGISPDKLEIEKLSIILYKLSMITKLDNHLYHLNVFLTYCSKRIPEELTDFLLNRLDRPENKVFSMENRYQPLPFIEFDGNRLNGISSSPNYREILRKVRDRSLIIDLSNSFWLSKLFSYISNNFSPESLEVLNEWVNSGDQDKIKSIGVLVKETPPDFIFLNPAFVSNLLEKAYMINDECYQYVLSSLSNSSLYGPRTGFVGQPSPQDELLRDQAKDFMEKYPIGSPTRRLYEYIYKESLSSIRRWINEDEDEDFR